jgi:hypothetical protein
MGFRVPDHLVEPFVAGLCGVMDVDGGPTPEQTAVWRAVVTHLLGRGDLASTGVEPIDPPATATALDDALTRQRFHELALTLETCRHPLTSAQVDRVEEYCDALGVDGPDRAIFRDLVRAGTEQAAADFQRFLDRTLGDRVEPQLRHVPIVADAPEPELAETLLAFASLPDDSLGRAFVDFHTRNRLAIPGVAASPINHFFVGHDMTHVIAGIEPTGPGEVALSAFQMAVDDTPLNTAALLAALVVHEAGFERSPSVGAEALACTAEKRCGNFGPSANAP